MTIDSSRGHYGGSVAHCISFHPPIVNQHHQALTMLGEFGKAITAMVSGVSPPFEAVSAQLCLDGSAWREFSGISRVLHIS